jgi:molybdopterin synthase sulfur carrier subunit
MKLRILYFARLREAMGRSSEAVEVPPAITTVAALRTWLIGRGEPAASAFADLKRIRAAVNQDMASDDTTLADGAEVAFFPPVTGG